MASPLSSPVISQEAKASEQSRKELQDRLNGLGGINGRRLDPEARAKKLREACEGFESIFIQKMWQEMRNAIPKAGLMQSREERYWQDMYDQELAKSMTSAGGIGLADMMFEQLSRNLVSASRSAADQGYASAFTPSAAPLITEAGAPDAEHEAPSSATPVSAPAQASAAKPMPSIYDGEAPQTAMEPAGTAAALAANAAIQATPEPPKAVPAGQPVQERRKERVERSREIGDSGIQQAYLAQRDAGDKLGSRAVRPALRPHRERRAENIAQPPVQAQTAPTAAQAAPMPGSPEALRQAMELAKSGAPAQVSATAENLNAMMAEFRSRNQSAAPQPSQAPQAQPAQQTAEAPQATGQSGEAVPVTRKVRYTTNIPQKGKNQKAGQPIRMLNTDNVGINSRAGQGLAAYHAAQRQAPAPAAQVVQAGAPAQGTAAQPAAISTGIAPLTPQSLNNSTSNDSGNFSIPPLTASDLRS